MQQDFWHQRWQNNQIGFHLPEANPLLVQYFSALNLNTGSRVFLPLCGKTLDIAWLLAEGYQVVGAELSQLAITALFDDLKLTPTITQHADITQFSADNIDIFVGDIFHLTQEVLGHVDATYDRAALVALPDEMRQAYAAHLLQMTCCAPQLLICFEYDQSLVAGPPFSISEEAVRQYYEAFYDLNLLASVTMQDGLKGQYPATEHVWLLKPQ